MPKKKIIKTYAIIVLIFVFLIITPMLLLAKFEEKEQYEAYLNEFYRQLDDTLYSVEYLLSMNEEKDITNTRLMNIEQQLETTNLLLRMGDKTVNNNISSQPRFFVGRIILNSLNDDGSLTNEQRSELDKVQKGLAYMKEGIYSEQTSQENKNLSANEFNEIIEKGARIGLLK